MVPRLCCGSAVSAGAWRAVSSFCEGDPDQLFPALRGVEGGGEMKLEDVLCSSSDALVLEDFWIRGAIKCWHYSVT